VNLTESTRCRRLVLGALCAVSSVLALAAAAAPPAAAATFTDVPKTQWAYGAISAVTNLGPADRPSARALVDFGSSFKPDALITKTQLAKALVLAGNLQNVLVSAPVALADLSPADPNYLYVQIALKYGFLYTIRDSAGHVLFQPTRVAREWEVDRAVVHLLRAKNAADDWRMLSLLHPTNWQPNTGWKTGAPIYISWEVAARALGLRYNHPAAADAIEASPMEGLRRAEVAWMINAALHVSSWRIDGLAAYDNVKLPTLSTRQKQIVAFAVKYIGYPYVWAGEMPTAQGARAPYGPQPHGGFDCSGFVWWVMKINFHYPIKGRGAHDIAQESKSRIAMSKLVAGDIIFFAPKGPKSNVTTIFHAGIALGNGWFIHSTGSNDGVSISCFGAKGDYWYDNFAWGRRVLSAAELTLAQ
jgi:hypothetical protein